MQTRASDSSSREATTVTKIGYNKLTVMLYCIRGKGQEVCGEVCELLDVWWVWGGSLSCSLLLNGGRVHARETNERICHSALET